MTLQDYSLTAFTVLNGARIFAYVPQIVCVCRDRTGASSVSMSTWGTFCAANLATVFYAIAGTGDRVVAGIFALNAVACISIFALILRNRAQHAWRNRLSSDVAGSARLMLTCLLMALRLRLESRLADRHAGDRWSDSVERSINEQWFNHYCGRA